MIELRFGIVASAHQGQHLASVWIEGNQRHLRIDIWFAEFPVARMLPVDSLVDHVNGGIHRIRRNALKLGVERRVDGADLRD